MTWTIVDTVWSFKTSCVKCNKAIGFDDDKFADSEGTPFVYHCEECFTELTGIDLREIAMDCLIGHFTGNERAMQDVIVDIIALNHELYLDSRQVAKIYDIIQSFLELDDDKFVAYCPAGKEVKNTIHSVKYKNGSLCLFLDEDGIPELESMIGWHYYGE